MTYLRLIPHFGANIDPSVDDPQEFFRLADEAALTLGVETDVR